MNTHATQFRNIAADYDRADPTFAARMREHADAAERAARDRVFAIPSMPTVALVVENR